MASFYWWSIEWSRKSETEDLDSIYGTSEVHNNFSFINTLYFYVIDYRQCFILVSQKKTFFLFNKQFF